VVSVALLVKPTPSVTARKNVMAVAASSKASARPAKTVLRKSTVTTRPDFVLRVVSRLRIVVCPIPKRTVVVSSAKTTSALKIASVVTRSLTVPRFASVPRKKKVTEQHLVASPMARFAKPAPPTWIVAVKTAMIASSNVPRSNVSPMTTVSL
jgi:hypothetical protein